LNILVNSLSTFVYAFKEPTLVWSCFMA
jgi:hypothetical protein